MRLVDWPQPILAAAEKGDYGKVIRLARVSQNMTQEELGRATGYSQAAISRIERGGPAAYDIRVLRLFSKVLRIPHSLLGLADSPTAEIDPSELPVKRREFLAKSTAVAAFALPTAPDTRTEMSRAIHTITGTQRRLDASVSSRELVGPVRAHLRMAIAKSTQVTDPIERRAIAAAASEAAGFAAWLHWDMQDIGSAYDCYRTAIKAARTVENPLLTAYMLGSLASLSLYHGDAEDALAFLAESSGLIGPAAEPTPRAWLACLEASAHAVARAEYAAWSALDKAAAAIEQADQDGSPPWPWVFPFDHRKLATQRLRCAVSLHKPEQAFLAAQEIGKELCSGHLKQDAILLLDLASAHIQSGDPDEGFRLATRAVTVAIETRSARVLESARRLRRSYPGPTASFLRDFDETLRSATYPPGEPVGSHRHHGASGVA